MSTYIPSSENARDSAPMLYLREPLQDSYPSETPILAGNVMMYMNFSSASTGGGEFSGTLAGASQQPNSCTDIPNIGVHDSNVVSHQEFLSSMGESWRDGRNHEMMLMDQMGSRNLQQGQGQGLSLSLSSHIQPTGIQFHSGDYRNPNIFFRPESSSVITGFHGNNLDSIKTDVSPYGIGNVSRGITDSKYLKSAQELLNEIVNVGKALKQQNSRKESTDDSKGIDDESKNIISPNQELNELSANEKQDLQNKTTKLIAMLDEVDRRYKQYYHQMQIVVSAFDVIAGCGAARPYTSLALQTISRHFRCLRDAINNQIKAAQRSLGETDSAGNGKGIGISRLRFVDQQLRQQRALQQLGMIQQHTWRPQRGLPETSVSVLRAWLFEHFLHPYPKDSDKIMLARQTGLTRSQVSNWFINARVRLWKPMVEEMYKEEAGEAGMESNSSSEIAPKHAKRDRNPSDDQGETEASKLTNQDMVGTSNESDFQNMMVNRGEHERLMAAAYQIPGRFGNGNVGGGGGGGGGVGGVSLTLGLQHCEDGSLQPMASNHHHSFGGGGGGVYDAGGGSSVGPETVDFDCVDSGNQRQRFGSSHLLHDFVA
ncbi:BEL1-like homeodomain protein 7 [Lactuca sativa]|uniref:BEL1-like homeodomain protein 7 n=1 Tax=Lactuca sativa TaxID=4236 RepID=UPI000CD972D9|nr:BEL1-like homeodomain protein 7 [Lactuca sativa]XP_042753867.1 BEL1-like homeodomain protein 7 [Lactuca sativa]XP_052623121.1 BEL1-like homeodomain protein 7 [Lactuca sativa]